MLGIYQEHAFFSVFDPINLLMIINFMVLHGLWQYCGESGHNQMFGLLPDSECPFSFH